MINSEFSSVYNVTWYEYNYVNSTAGTEGDYDYNEINPSDVDGGKYVEISTKCSIVDNGSTIDFYSKMGNGGSNSNFIIGYYAQIKYTFQLFDTENYAIGKPSGSGGGVLLASNNASNGYTPENHNVDVSSARSELIYDTPTVKNLSNVNSTTELITLYSLTTSLPINLSL